VRTNNCSDVENATKKKVWTRSVRSGDNASAGTRKGPSKEKTKTRGLMLRGHVDHHRGSHMPFVFLKLFRGKTKETND